MSDYIPTTEQVRKSYIHAYASQQFFGPAASANRAGLGAEFDCWLAAHDAELRAQIAAEAQEALSAHFHTLVHPMTPFADTAREVHGYRAAIWVALNAIRNPKEQP